MTTRCGEKDEKLGQRKTACVYQIWDKAGGKVVRYIAPSYKDDQLDEQEDPLGLTGFFNMPRPLQFVKKSSDLVPTAPYLLYKIQAQELNRITKLINKIVEAIKARGAYDGALGELMKKIFDGDDNALIPADSVSSLSAEKGFQNAIWMIPVDVLVTVLTQQHQSGNIRCDITRLLCFVLRSIRRVRKFPVPLSHQLADVSILSNDAPHHAVVLRIFRTLAQVLHAGKKSRDIPSISFLEL